MTESTSFVSSANRLQRRLITMSATIAAPSPPRITSIEIGTSTAGSSAKPVRLRNPPIRSKPALLNAEIEWNRPCHAAWAGSG